MTIVPRNLRLRTAAFIAAAFFLFLSLFFLTTYLSIRGSLVARSDGETRDALQRIASELYPGIVSDSIARILSLHRAIGESALRYIIFERPGTQCTLRTRDETIPIGIETQLTEQPGTPISYSTSEGDMRLIGIASSHFLLGAAYNTIVIEEAEESIIEVFAYSLIAGMIIAIASGIILSRYLIGPIETLASAARRISASTIRMPARLPVPNKIAEISELAQSINTLLDAREQAIEQQRNFASDAAHELRTPLTVLKGEIEVELRVTPHGERNELLQSNLEEIERLIAIVQDLLELAEIEADEKQTTEQCSLLSAIHYAADRLRPLAEEKKITFLLPDDDILVRAQEPRMTRLIYNLLLNAVQHSNMDGTVAVRIERTNTDCILRFEDTGAGIPQNRLEHLFQRFYRAGHEDRRGGAGLGLAIVKSIADRYGFSLAVQSQSREGTTVSVNIPNSAIANSAIANL